MVLTLESLKGKLMVMYYISACRTELQSLKIDSSLKEAKNCARLSKKCLI